MPFHVRDAETNTLVRRLASRQQLRLTDAIKTAVRNELKRLDDAVPLRDRLAPLIADIRAHRVEPDIRDDKAFWDDLSGDT